MIRFEKKCEEIISFLNAGDNISKSPGLLSGDIGRLLLNLHYVEYTKDEDLLDKTFEKLEEYLGNVVVESMNPNHCFGLSGFALFVEYIEQKGWLEVDTNDILGEIDEYLYQKMMALIRVGNYDFLHGAIGIGLYFIYRLPKTTLAKEYLHEILVEIEQQAISDKNGGVKWNFYDFVKFEKITSEVNLGLSHGMPSIICFLVKLYKNNIYTNQTLDLIKKGILFIRQCQLPVSETYSHFPDYVNEQANEYFSSRLAWCYGDLGMCCMLWQVADLLDDAQLKTDIIDILTNAALKRTVEQTRIIDAGLCHGAAGAAHIFQRFYELTNLPVLKEAADFWYDTTLNMAVFDDGYVGYKTVFPEEYGGNRPSIDFLEGISGIGLVLLYRISGLDSSWEEFLFIR